MKYLRTLLLLALIQTVASVLHAQTNIGADDPNIQYIGRFDMTTPTAPGFDWSYSTIRAKFQGTSCSVKLDGFSKYFDVFIDGVKTGSITNASSGLQTYQVASGLSDTVHSISLCRRAEASSGKNIFQGFVLDSGKTLVAPGVAPSRRIAFIGDSYTCGYGDEAAFGTPFTSATENACITYAAQLATNYNADCMITAWSGRGMVRNYGDANQTSPDPMPTLYARTCGSVAANDYAFAWQPDAVVIVLGINDFSTTPYPSEAQYVGGYSNFVKTVRSHYPNADILCTYWSSMNSIASNFIATVASTSGDSKVHFASVLYNLNVPADFGSDYHPNASGHTKIANAFIPVFDSIMGTNWGSNTNSGSASTTVSVNFGSTLSSMPAYGLGVGCSVYDYGMTASGSAPAVANAGATAIRYPGGSFADIYHWQTGTACNGGYVAPGTGFDTFMNNLVNPAGAKAVITCNYGTDPTCSTGASPSEAAAWVRYANVTKGYGIKYWEIGNEQAGNGFYGSSFEWEPDLHADKSPMAYGQNAAAFSSAMKAVDSTVKIGVGVIQPGSWPDTDGSYPYNKCVLTNCASAVDFVILHWYPDGTAAQSLQSPTRIPGIASSMRSQLNTYVGARASSVEIWITETGPGTNTGPAGALYTSDTYLTWIENGAQNVDFQELHQGFLAEGISGVADHAPIWGAYGCRMARNLASVGDTFVTASSGTTNVGVHAVRKTNGHYGVMLINRDPTNSYTITVNAGGAALASSGTRYDFGAANFGSSIYPSSGPTQSTITGIGSSSFSITIPAYTMSVVDIPEANVPPVAPANLVATPTDSAVQLSWNGSGGADSYIVKRSTTSGSGYTNIATGVTATSFTDTGLVNGTTYYYVVAATNVYGVSPDSTEASATPGLVANLIVNTVGTLNGNGQTFFEATGNSLNGATLAANIATAFANNAGGVWDFEGPNFNLLDGQTVALNYGISLAHSLVLTVNNGGGMDSNQSNNPGEATSGSNVLGFGGGANTRTFTPNKPLLTVAIFNTDRNEPTRIPVLTVTFQDTTTASTSGANADNVYFHCLSGTATNPIVSFAISQNDFVRYDDLALIVAKPPAPQNLTATPGDAHVALAWSAAPNATAYYVKRSNTSSNFTTIATNLTLAFTNTGLNNGTLYYYVVSAVGAAGEGTNSIEVSARPKSFVPTQLGFAAAGNQLQLNWPADHTGWQLQSQTNSLAIGLGTNWVTVPGSTQTNQVNLTVDPVAGAKFFRLVKP